MQLSDNLLYLPRYGDTPAAAYVVEPKWQQMKLYGFKCIARVRHYQAEYCLTDPSNIVCLWNTIVTKLASAKFVCFVMPWFGLSVHVCRNVVCVKTDLYYDRSLSCQIPQIKKKISTQISVGDCQMQLILNIFLQYW